MHHVHRAGDEVHQRSAARAWPPPYGPSPMSDATVNQWLTDRASVNYKLTHGPCPRPQRPDRHRHRGRRQRRPPGSARHRVGGGRRARRRRRRAGRPLRRRVPRRRPHVGGDQRVARRVAPGRPQAVLRRSPATSSAGRRAPGRRSSTRVEHRGRLRARATSAPSTCCSGCSRPGASARRSSAATASRRRPSPIRCSPARPATTPAPPTRRSPRSPPRCSAARSPRRSRWATTTSAPSTCCSACSVSPRASPPQILAGAGATHADVKAKVVQILVDFMKK